jgi:hypothetical protein
MLLDVLASLDALLFLFHPCFSQPTFQTFRAMVVGQLSQTGLLVLRYVEKYGPVRGYTTSGAEILLWLVAR